MDCMNTGRRKHFFQYFLLFTTLVLGMTFYGIKKIYGFSLYPDEFGYWSTAATLIGYDWSQVASLGSYYAFGYSVILTPILLVFEGGVWAYRAAVVVNALLQIVDIFLLWSICKILFPKIDEQDSIFVSGIAGLYPVLTYYSQTTLAEGLLTFLYILACYLFCRFIFEPKLINGILFLIIIILMLCTHLRTVGIVVAAFLTILVWVISNQKYRKYALILVISLIVGVIITLIIKNIVQSNIYSSASSEVLAGNSFAGQLVTIRNLLSIEGMLGFLMGLCGKIYYLLNASFGLFGIAMVYLIRRSLLIVDYLKRGKETGPRMYIGLFVLLGVTFQVLITAAYMNNVTELDKIAYGRYQDYMIPIIMLIGVTQVIESKHIDKCLIITTITSIAMLGITIYCSLNYENMEMRRYFLAGISYAWKDKAFKVVNHYLISFALSILLMLMIFGCVRLARKKSVWQMAYLPIILTEVILALVLNNRYIYPSSEIDKKDMEISAYIQQSCMDNEVYYLSETDRTFIDILQFDLGQKKINVITDPDTVDNKGVLITDIDTGYAGQLEENYSQLMNSAWFRLYKVQEE